MLCQLDDLNYSLYVPNPSRMSAQFPTPHMLSFWAHTIRNFMVELELTVGAQLTMLLELTINSILLNQIVASGGMSYCYCVGPL